MSVDPRLRVALWTWSRRDRRASGQVAVDTALDLIDAGGSVGREARSLARTGLTLRVRGTFRDLRTAPWRESLPLIAMLTASLAVAIVATDAGGWSQMWSGGASGQPFVSMMLVGTSAVVILAAAARIPSLTFNVQALVALFVAQWWIAAPNLGDHAIAFEPDGPMFLSGDMAFADVPLIGVVGLLLGAGAGAALIWLLLNFNQRRAPAHSPKAPRRTWALGLACLTLPVVSPRIGQALLELSRSFLSGTANGLNEGSQPVFLTVALWLLVFAVAVAARRRWPALTVAACATCAALWVPFILVTSPFLFSPAAQPVSAASDDRTTMIALWTTLTLVAIAIALSLIARAGESARSSCGAPAEARESAGGPMLQA